MSASTLLAAPDRAGRASPPRVLGQLLLAAGEVTPEDLDAALEEQRRTRERLGEVLVRRGADAEAVARALAAQLRLPFAEAPLEPEPAALALVDPALAARLRVVPLAADARAVRVAMADPLDARAIDDLQFQTGRRIEPVVATPSAVAAALAAYHHGMVDEILDRMPETRGARAAAEAPDVIALRRASEAPPVVALVDLVLARAAKARASDIHIEPAEGRTRVRARVDGALRELLTLPEQAALAFASRIKVMSDMDIAVKRRPQDGRASVRIDGRPLALRVSTLPAQGGEKIVIRILDPGGAGSDIDALGFDADTRVRFLRLLERSHGVLLVTGPTGSGKTTTLYTALGRLDRERRNILTLEDPIEYRLEGLTQVQVHRKAGLGFPAALRAALRQDPDVIMVGELRDRETVEIAMAAAMTGHLVLSTIHTNDAASAATRLTEMGAPAWLIAAGLIGVLAQRLVRRLCPECARRRPARAGELREAGLAERPVHLFTPGGCRRCDGSGYRGRIGIFELLPVDPLIRRLVLNGGDAARIRDAARAGGMRTLAEDAWAKASAGWTTLEEVKPLIASLAAETPGCPQCGRAIGRGFRACPGCGHALRRLCGCGARLHAGWAWCARCGKRQTGPAGGNGDGGVS
ncbi:MAG: Flp pilus assembly complex ATPase component TadA [Gemmatimonadetes bacterium]|nr:Flp pilus assembly complex ATPase component TadA [Gemmatimonadota bacterium]